MPSFISVGGGLFVMRRTWHVSSFVDLVTHRVAETTIGSSVSLLIGNPNGNRSRMALYLFGAGIKGEM